ncbi:hypothetical protein ABW20_dc0100320 [Dactylellina cionopaga]|nr:hypothetical protein ABW20_dc0100320 [Dactylellina cionopaga]
MTKVFLIGATGYIGGTVLADLTTRYPSIAITALVRTKEKASLITAAHPSVTTILGDLDSTDILISEASKSDIIITTADSDHPPHIRDIYEGMSQSKSGKPTYLIHTSGTGIFLDLSFKRAGEAVQSAISDRIWDDVADYQELIDLPEDLLHMNVDVLVRQPPLDRNPNIKYAVVVPPLIYGEGSGPVNKRSIQIPTLIDEFLKRGKAFNLGKGENTWSNVHIQDLSEFYLLLVEEALKENGGKANWNTDGGFYFAENGEHVVGEATKLIAKIAHEKGLIAEGIDELDLETVKKINPKGPGLWSTNSLSRATRARKLLGWAPKEISLEASLEDEVDAAVRNFQKSKASAQ